MTPDEQGAIPKGFTDQGAVPSHLEGEGSDREGPDKEVQDVQTSPIFVGSYSDVRFGIWVKGWLARLHERTRELEWWRKDIQRRLQEGAQSFDDLRKAVAVVDKRVSDVDKKTQPHPKPLWVILSFCVTVAMIIASIAWTAGHYPSRGEFDSLKDHVTKMEVHFTEEIGNLKVTVAEMKGIVGSVKEGVARVESVQKDNSDKLDRLLDRHR